MSSHAKTATPALGWVRALPTLLRVGMSECLAYRAEFIVWMLTTTLPLVMLGLWTSVADDAQGPFGSFTSDHFVAYYLVTLILRNVTGSWVVWQLDWDIRSGGMSMRLLRPVHPFVTYATTHLASVPLRGLVAIPFTVILLLTNARHLLTGDPALIAIFFVSLIGAWAITFFLQVMIGTLGFYIDKTQALFEVYLGVFAVLSGYLIPLRMLPEWAQQIAAMAPFRYVLAFPVETLMGFYDRAEALRLLGVQWFFVIGIYALSSIVWRAGIRRYEAFGS